MRHRDDAPQPRAPQSRNGETSKAGAVHTLDQAPSVVPVVPTQPKVGRHKAPVTPLIPTQKTPTRGASDTVVPQQSEALPEVTIPVPSAPVPAVPVPDAETGSAPEADEPDFVAPHTARWKASHGPRMLAGVLLVLAVGGTSALGLDYQQNPGGDQLISLAIGIAVVVGLWAMLIASTPQVVSLRGSVLTIHNSSGTERFDLGDGQQAVDIVGEPRSSKWALVLHRANRTSLVLRRRDVDAVQLDPIVRHYRAIAHRRHSERQARFKR